MKVRDKLIDIAKGVGILLVVFAHTYSGTLSGIIYYFHMPLFFMLTGCALTYSSQSGLRWGRLTRSIVVPYLAFSLLCFTYWALLESKFRPIQEGNLFPWLANVVSIKGQQFINIFTAISLKDAFLYNVVLWFLPCLFVCRVLFGWLTLSRHPLALSVILATMGYGWVYGLRLSLPWCMELALVVLPLIFLAYRGYEAFREHVSVTLALISVGGGGRVRCAIHHLPVDGYSRRHACPRVERGMVLRVGHHWQREYAISLPPTGKDQTIGRVVLPWQEQPHHHVPA